MWYYRINYILNLHKNKRMSLNKTFKKDEAELTFKSGNIDYGPKRKNRSRYLVLSEDNEQIKNILIKGARYVITADENDTVVVKENQTILVEDGTITKVIPKEQEDKIDVNKVDLIYDAEKRTGLVVTPGFINAHAHPPMYMLRSANLLEGEEGTLEEALENAVKLERAMNDEDLYISTLASLTEEQKMGTTTTLSHYHTPEITQHAAEICNHRLINAVSVASQTNPKANIDEAEKYILSFLNKYGGDSAKFKESDPLIRPALCIHEIFRADMTLLKKIKKLINKYHVHFTLHLGETAIEVENCVKKFGKRPIEVLDEAGLLDRKLIISHGVHLTNDEVTKLAKKDVGVIHLPTSNLIHKSGLFKYSLFVEHEATNQIALGTDSVISKNRLDLITEALQARIIHQKNIVIYYHKLFKMITSNSAKILGIPNIGKIQEGYKADIAFWKLKDRGFIPYDEQDPMTLIGNLITHGGRNIRDLMIAGQFVIVNRVHTLVDESKLLAKTQELHQSLRKRVKK